MIDLLQGGKNNKKCQLFSQGMCLYGVVMDLSAVVVSR